MFRRREGVSARDVLDMESYSETSVGALMPLLKCWFRKALHQVQGAVSQVFGASKHADGEPGGPVQRSGDAAVPKRAANSGDYRAC
jgi:hypothetical protein